MVASRGCCSVTTWRWGVALAIGWGMIWVGASHAASPEQVAQAIEKARAYLLKVQKNDNWELAPIAPPDMMKDAAHVTGGQYGGLTAIATYALLAGGESPQTPAVQQAVKFLVNANMIGVYAVGMRAQVWGYLPPTAETKAALRRDGEILVRAMRSQGPARGLYYYAGGNGATYDHSVSQFGVLGVWAAAQGFFEVPYDYWREADRAWRAHQLPNGAWCYMNGDPGPNGKENPAMTAAGIATLFISSDYIHAQEFVDCRGNLPDKNIEAGLKWMGDHFHTVLTFGDRIWYTLYGLERIGVASGRKYIGSNNWFTVGADWLIQHQNPDGSWGGGDKELWGRNFHNTPQTAFGILFLARGRAPVMLQKLQYQIKDGNKMVEGPWNQRPRDAANLARWAGHSIEHELNWQSTNLAAPIDELHDAPILYIAGNKPLAFTDDEKKKLKQYVEEGGMILANADCDSAPFAASFVKLGQELFRYEFRELPQSHPIYTNSQFLASKWSVKPAVQALGNSVRELMILIPRGDPSRRWQLARYVGHEEVFQLINNIYLYAIDKESDHYKGETHIVRPRHDAHAGKTIKVARLMYGGNCDPEPGGWRRLAAVMHNDHATDLSVQSITAGEGKLKQFTVAHITGTTGWKLPEKASAEIRDFVNGGGTLVVDAAGGAAAFAQAAQDNIEAIFPGAGKKLENPLAPNHAIYSALGHAAKIDYRVWARKALAGDTRSPHIRGYDVRGRTAVFFSPEDLSAGLVGNPVDGILGYSPESATDLMAGILLYASGGKP